MPKYLLWKSELITYIPYYEIYNGTVEEMVYTSRILRDNFKRLNTKTTTWTRYINLCSTITVWLLKTNTKDSEDKLNI